MALADEARRILDGFDSAAPGEIADVLERIGSSMRSSQVREYLAGKIEGVRTAEGAEARDLCKNLRPYLYWAVDEG